MRSGLQKIIKERKRFSGTFVRFGKKAGFRGRSQETILIKNIVDLETGEKVTDHLWFNLTSEFAALRLFEGDTLEFDARVKGYVKGYVNKPAKIDQRSGDYKLSHPTKVMKCN